MNEKESEYDRSIILDEQPNKDNISVDEMNVKDESDEDLEYVTNNGNNYSEITVNVIK